MAARQDAEREDIINRVTKTSASSLSSSMSSLNSSGAGQGRVRRMFEDRRNNRGYHQSSKGIDKSHPLEPVRRGDRERDRDRDRDRDYGRLPPNGKSSSRYNDGMTRSRSQANMQRANRGDNRSTRTGKSLSHHKSTSSLMDNNYRYNSSSRGPSPGTPSSTKSSPGPRGAPVAPARRKTSRNDNNKLRVNDHRSSRRSSRSKSRSRTPSPAPSVSVVIVKM